MSNWYRESSPPERKTFWACFLGWGLDALDVQMFSLVIPALIATFGVSRTEAGMLGAVTLFTGALGGWLGGALADRYGRVKALQVTVLWFALATFACAFAQNFTQLLVLKAIQGIGFGGEWAAGAVLMAEVIRPQHRGKALGAVQSAWAVGWGSAVLLSTLVFTLVPADLGWRLMFGLGLLPALLVLYVRRTVPEPLRTTPAQQAQRKPLLQTMSGIFGRDVLRATLIGGLFGTGAHGGYSALTTFLPTFLRQDRGLSVLSSGGYLAVIIVAFFTGCIGLRNAVRPHRPARQCRVLRLVVHRHRADLHLRAADQHADAVLGLPARLLLGRHPGQHGGAVQRTLPRRLCAGTGVGFCYNFGRILSAAFPVMVGFLSERIGLGPAIGFDAAFAYSLVLLAVLLLPETKGKTFTETEPAAPQTAEPAALAEPAPQRT